MDFARYCEEGFPAPEGEISLPLADEAFVAAWEGYAREAEMRGAWETLRGRLPQLQFPIAAGVSETEAYRAATRKGERVELVEKLELEEPGSFSFYLHPTAAGRVPVLVVRHRADFVTLVRALAHRGEPVAIPDSQGASMVAGFTNWDRIKALGARPGTVEWELIKGQRELYQDRFMILSDGPYSGVKAEELGLGEVEWREKSLVIRREHEGTHYFTKRVLGVMRNHALDEVVADYMGICAAGGIFLRGWFERFFGIGNKSEYRRGGRLENYCKGLSESDFLLVCEIVRGIGVELERLENILTQPVDRMGVMLALCGFRLDELAKEGAAERIADRVKGQR